MKVSHCGKNGDLIYALPVIKALARRNGGKIDIFTSGLCFQIVPLLMEQPYIGNVEMDYTRSYKITENCLDPWAVLPPEEGMNLSPQPAMYRPDAPVCWTNAYGEVAGIKELTFYDRIALPTLLNHRLWYYGHRVEYQDNRKWTPPMTCVIAPESETLKCAPWWVWRKIAERMQKELQVVFIGQRRDDPAPAGAIDLRGHTTVSSIARLLAEARVVVCANSLPWHLSRHAGTPTITLQDQVLERCTPVDTPSYLYTSANWEKLCEDALWLANNRMTMWTNKELDRIGEAMAEAKNNGAGEWQRSARS